MSPWPALLSALALRGAAAEPGDHGLHWHAPAQCPTAQVVIERAEALGGSAADARVEVVEIPGGFEARITAGDRTRRLQSPSCDELATAVALSFVRGEPTPDAPPEPTDDPPPATEPRSPTLPEPRERTSATDTAAFRRSAGAGATSVASGARVRARRDPTPPLGPALIAAGRVGYGVLLHVDGGGGGAFAWRGRSWAIELGGFALAPDRHRVAGIDARASLGATSVLGCGRIVRGWFEARPCGGIELGATRVRARGPGVRSQAFNLWAGVQASMRVMAWMHDRVALALGVGVVIPVRHTEYAKGKTPLFPARAAALTTSLGLEIALGRRR